MELKGERVLPVSREVAWKALNDVDALKAAVPGCESLVAAGDNGYDVVVNSAIGPVKARFKGKLELADVQVPSPTSFVSTCRGPAVCTRRCACGSKRRGQFDAWSIW